jgi:hypothetical protein
LASSRPGAKDRDERASDRASAQRLTGLMLATRLNPLWILMTGGALGGLGLL